MSLFDIRTVILSYIISNAICLIVIGFLWSQNRRRFQGLDLWLADFAMQFTAILLVAMRGTVPDFLSIVVSNVLAIAGTILLYMGLERFVGKKSSQVHNYFLLGAFILIHTYFTFFQPSLLIRTINLAAAIILLCFQCAWLLIYRVDSDMRPITRRVGYIFLTFCLSSILRILVDLVVNPGNDFFQSGFFEGLAVLINQMLFVVLTFGLVLMVNRRLVTAVERDIDERKITEEALKLSEEKFYKAFHSSPDAVLITRLSDGKLVEVNEGFSRLTGYSAEEALASSSINLHLWERPEDRNSHIADLQKGRRVHEHEYNFRTKSGRILNCLVSGEIISLGKENHVISVVRDISEQKSLAEALRKRNEALATLHQVSLDLVNRHDMDDILQTLLAKISTMFDASHVSIDLIENDDMLVTYAATSDQPLQKGDRMRRGEGGWLSWQAIDTGEPAILDDYSTWSSRRELYENFPIHAVMIVPIKQRDRVIGAINFLRMEPDKHFTEIDSYAAQQLAQMVALVLDNSQLYNQLQTELAGRIQNEEILQETQAELIANQRTLAVFDERQRLARDLHDSVNQSLHGLVLFSETLVSTLDRNHVDRAKQIADRLQESARQALKETRLMLYELQPAGSGRSVELVQDLEARLAMVERRAGVKAQIIVEGSMDNCPVEWNENLFWITIEALNNALKHAQARKVQITIRCLPQRVELEILDKGKGFDPSKPRAGGLGLRNMRERAGMLGGELIVEATPKIGTCVRFTAEIKAE